jgi:hypothetical protein
MAKINFNQTEMYFRRRCQILFRKLFAPLEGGEISYLLEGVNEFLDRRWREGGVKYLAIELNVPKKCFNLEAQRYEHSYIAIDRSGRTEEHSFWPGIWPYWGKNGVFRGREKVPYPTALDEIHFFNGIPWHDLFLFFNSWAHGNVPVLTYGWPEYFNIDIFQTLQTIEKKAA